MDLRASWNGSKLEGCETLLFAFAVGSSFFTVARAGAFLNEGSFALDLGAEKNDESALASFTETASAFASFLTTIGFVDAVVPTAAFLVGAAGFVLESAAFRFFVSAYYKKKSKIINRCNIDRTDPLLDYLPAC